MANTKKEPQLSEQTIKNIERARKQIRKGKFYTQAEVDKLLGLK